MTAHRDGLAFALSLAAFVSLGLPDAVPGVAWPSMRRMFGLPVDALGLLLAAGVAGYVASSFFAGPLTRRLGMGGLLVASSGLVAGAAAASAGSPAFVVVAVAAFMGGCGGGAIDAAINAHAARHFSPGRVAWLHGSWGIGAALGPLIMTAALSRGGSWRAGYAVVALLVGFLAAAFAATRGLWGPSHDTAGPAGGPGLLHTLGEGIVRAQVALFLLYAGVEAAAGQWAFTLLTEGRGMEPTSAGLAVAGYWGGLTTGRLVSGALASRLPPATLLRGATVLAPVCATAFALGLGPRADTIALLALGFAAGPVFPLLVAATPRRVGVTHASNAVGVQVSAAALGSAALPALAGVLGRRLGLDAIAAFVAVAAVAVLVLHEVLDRAASNLRSPRTV